MVKEIVEVQRVPHCTAEDFFKLVYFDTHALSRFHAEVNSDPTAAVPEWDGPSRTLTFHTPVNAPAVLTTLVGSSRIAVVETQSFSITPTGGIRLQSVPVPQVPGGGGFSSTAVLEIQDAGDEDGAGCCITVTVKVSAAGPWGLVGTIETFMATAAQDGTRQFLDYCVAYVSELAAADQLQPSLASLPTLAEILSPPLPPPMPVGGSTAPSEAAVEFYDAEEPDLRMLVEAAEADRMGRDEEEGEEGDEAEALLTGITRDELSTGAEPATLDDVFLSMWTLCRSAKETASLLQSIDARLERLEREAAEERMIRKWGWAEWSSQARHAALLLGVAVTSAAVTTLYWRTRRTNTY